jgi:ADP-ribose pyrophosphatase
MIQMLEAYRQIVNRNDASYISYSNRRACMVRASFNCTTQTISYVVAPNLFHNYNHLKEVYMLRFGVVMAIFQDDRLLLTKRNDFEIWCLPGGMIDAGESLVEAAVRETREETGLEVEATHLIGLYSQISAEATGHTLLFGGRLISGSLNPDPNEVIDIGYFARHEMPGPVLFSQRQLIEDAWDGLRGSAYRYEVKIPPGSTLSRQELYARRDRSGLNRQQFYLHFIEELQIEPGLRQLRTEADPSLEKPERS